MTVIRIGMVAEGKNDFAVLCPVVEKIVKDIDASLGVEFVFYQPELDATSGRYKRGGWSKVYAWCLKNTDTVRAVDVFGGGMFAATNPCDLLIVQLDADVIDEFAKKAPGVVLPPKPYVASQKSSFVEAVLCEWLWPANSAASDPHAGKIHPLAIVQAIETWLVAAAIPGIADPEEADPVPLIISVDPTLEDPAAPGVLLKTNVTAQYEAIAATLTARIPDVRLLCPQFEKFFLFIDGLVPKPVPVTD